jgi:hypothetical protein
MAMVVAQSQWATAEAAQWMAGWQCDCDGNEQRRREGNMIEYGNNGGTIAMGNGGSGAMDGVMAVQLPGAALQLP